MIHTLNTRSMQHLRDQNRNLTVINVLAGERFRREHIPGSRNVPLGEKRFVEAVKKETGGTDRKVVVYCSGDDCDASGQAAEKLSRAGFGEVYHYEGGMKAWKEAGLPVDSERSEANA